MKKILVNVIAIMAFIPFSYAQAPEGLNYQSIIRDAAGDILASQAVGLQFILHQTTPTGTAIYTEDFATTTDANGLVALLIGTGATTDDFSTLDWTAGPYFLETLIDITGGTTYISIGTSQLMSVPYALYAKTSGSSTPGPQGPAGIDGVDGATGAQGPVGPEGPPGTIPERSYMMRRPTSDTSMLVNTGTISFTTTIASSGVNITATGSTITLKKGFKYRCTANLHVTFQFNNDWTAFQWYSDTNFSWEGARGVIVTDNRNFKEGQAPRALAYFDLTSAVVDNVIRLRHRAGGVYTTVWGANGQTYCDCMQL